MSTHERPLEGHPQLLLAAALLGLTGVALGAWGVHGASFDPRAAAWWETGVHYQQVHAVALAALAWAPSSRASRALKVAGSLWLLGVVIFAGTLYAMALGGPRILGAVTPIGGLSLLAGWATVAAAAAGSLRRSRQG